MKTVLEAQLEVKDRNWRPPAPRVAIIGGGLAGMAAAAALVDQGLDITIYESRPRLGGRASSFFDSQTQELVDNCQHVSMGCCVNFADFRFRTGLEGEFGVQDTIRFLGLDGQISELRAGRLPAPFHLAFSFWKVKFLTLRDKLRLAWGVWRLSQTSRYEQSFETWLIQHGQNPTLRERFWEPVLASAVNETLDRMDFGLARKVIVDGLLRSRHGYALETPLAPLGQLFGERMEQWLTNHNIKFRLTTGVRSVETDNENAVHHMILRDGTQVEVDFCIIAVPFARVWSMLSSRTQELAPGLRGLEQIEASPIIGVHLWFNQSVCPFDHIGLLNRYAQWVFNHTAIQNRAHPSATQSESQYLQVVVSAARSSAKKNNDEILAAVLEDLGSIWPNAKPDNLIHSRVVVEHAATFSAQPGINQLRPSQRLPIDGLYLAGDWTATSWPATMEGAVRSGYLAAEGILRDLERPQFLLKPDLRGSWLSQLLVRS